MKTWQPMPDTNGGSDIELVEIFLDGLPRCVRHGAMNKVSDVFWRCHVPRCRAGIMEAGQV